MKRLVLINIVLMILLLLIPNTQEIITPINTPETPSIITSRNGIERKPIKKYSLTTDMDLREKSNLEASEYDTMLEGTNLEGIGEALQKAEQQFNINGLYLMGLCCLESGYGRSGYAIDRNNLVRLECS